MVSFALCLDQHGTWIYNNSNVSWIFTILQDFIHVIDNFAIEIFVGAICNQLLPKVSINRGAQVVVGLWDDVVLDLLFLVFN